MLRYVPLILCILILLIQLVGYYFQMFHENVYLHFGAVYLATIIFYLILGGGEFINFTLGIRLLLSASFYVMIITFHFVVIFKGEHGGRYFGVYSGFLGHGVDRVLTLTLPNKKSLALNKRKECQNRMIKGDFSQVRNFSIKEVMESTNVGTSFFR